MNDPTKCGNGNIYGVGKVPPCNNTAIHFIQSPTHEPLRLCDKCFKLVVARGLVSEPCVGKAEFDRREAARLSIKETKMMYVNELEAGQKGEPQ